MERNFGILEGLEDNKEIFDGNKGYSNYASIEILLLPEFLFYFYLFWRGKLWHQLERKKKQLNYSYFVRPICIGYFVAIEQTANFFSNHYLYFFFLIFHFSLLFVQIHMTPLHCSLFLLARRWSFKPHPI